MDGQVRAIDRPKVNLILQIIKNEFFYGYLKGCGFHFIVQPLARCVCVVHLTYASVILETLRLFNFKRTFWVSTSLDTYHRCFSLSNFAFKMLYVK